MKDKDYMSIALEEAKKALDEGNWPIGCVIELNGEIIARTHNQVYTTRNKLYHAEMLALEEVQLKLQDNRKKATLYTTYEPCPMCFGGIIVSRIKRVVCGVDLDNSGAMYLRKHLPKIFKKKNFSVKFSQGIMVEECAEVFMQSPRAIELDREGLLRKIDL
jgi:tRNA(adenine34) deaminase